MVAILLTEGDRAADALSMSRRLPYNVAQYLSSRETGMVTTVHIIEFSDYL
jgi:hypothetical protein